jgi:hypothetical protein
MIPKVVQGASTSLNRGDPAPRGWVVETIIEGRMAWLVEPVPLQPYTFTPELEKAHVFENHGHARDCKSSVWCWHDRWGQHPHLAVVWITDEYRAEMATKVATPLALEGASA